MAYNSTAKLLLFFNMCKFFAKKQAPSCEEARFLLVYGVWCRGWRGRLCRFFSPITL